MSTEYLTDKASKLLNRCRTRDPFEIAERIGIRIMFVDGLTELKGAYKIIKRNRWIFINSNLDDNTQKIICAHELGHDQLHRSIAKSGTLIEYMLYNTAQAHEYEANLFAAEILISDDDITELVNDYQYSAEQIAMYLRTDINLISLKCFLMTQKGYDLKGIDYQSDFLKRTLHFPKNTFTK